MLCWQNYMPTRTWSWRQSGVWRAGLQPVEVDHTPLAVESRMLKTVHLIALQPLCMVQSMVSAVSWTSHVVRLDYAATPAHHLHMAVQESWYLTGFSVPSGAPCVHAHMNTQFLDCCEDWRHSLGWWWGETRQQFPT